MRPESAISPQSRDFVRVPAQTAVVGSDRHYPEEGPARSVSVSEFWIQAHQVTNAEFAEFVDATGYVTVAERPLNAVDYPDAPAENLQPGSMVFTRTQGPVDLRHLSQWWVWTPGASWRHPVGPHSSIAKRADHPVVHVAYEDAESYAQWAGLALPTEAEWEIAARGGLEAATYTWGDEPEQPGQRLANYWHGDFPWRPDPGYGRTAPVGSFPPNDYGLFDMAGNVWEWTTDWYADTRRRRPVLRGRQLRPSTATIPGAAQGHQGWLVSLRRQLLPALPPRRPPTADGRHGHEPHRLSLCQALTPSSAPWLC